MKLSVKPLKKNKTESGRSKEDKPHRDVCNRACIFYIFFLQNTNTTTCLSEGTAVHDL